MSKMIQIRNVPDDVHRRLKVRAAQEGKSLSEMLLEEAIKLAERPSEAELLARLATRAPVEMPVSSAEIIREERDSR